MKSTAIKNNTAESHSSQAFFGKSKTESFFSSSEVPKKAFFSPSTIQAKLKVGPPDDQHEKEADAVADKVAQGQSNVVQRACAACDKEEKIQKKPLTPEEKAEDLQSDRFRDNSRLQKAFDNAPLIYKGETGEAIKLLQRALRDLGYPLPISFKKTGDADGIFGRETHAAMKQFQLDNGLDDDGIIGRNTMKALDEIFGNSSLVENCNITFLGGPFGKQEQAAFINKHFEPKNRSSARKILGDLCAVKGNILSFANEQELRDEIFKRLRIGQLMQQSQNEGAFAYPEEKVQKGCANATGNPERDAQVNKAAQGLWTTLFSSKRNYGFQLNDLGKLDAYEAIKLLFTPQDEYCDKTLIHCDRLVTIVKTLAFAETMGKEKFNEKVKAGHFVVHLTFNGMSIDTSSEKGKATPGTVGFQSVTPSSEEDLVIGDHVMFWNHLAYDAISVKRPGPWRLEYAVLVDKNSAGEDLFEGHGAPEVDGTVQPGTKKDVLEDLMDVYNRYAQQAVATAILADRGEEEAHQKMRENFPQVKKENGTWMIHEIARNKHRPKQKYVLRELSGVDDPELVGLGHEMNPNVMTPIKRPVESGPDAV